MSQTSRFFMPAVITAAVLIAAPSAPAQSPATQPSTQPSKAALQERIDTLQARVAALGDKQQRDQADVTSAIQSVMADADHYTQSMMIGSSTVNGWTPERGFVLSSEDGNFLLHPSALIQFRDETTDRQHIRPGGGGITGGTGYDMQNGFEISRLRLAVDGNVYSPLLSYYVQFDADQGVPFTLLDAYVMYRVSSQSPLALKVGQFKDPLFHEKDLLPGNQLAVDRSLLDSLIGGGETQRVQGGEMIYDENNLRGVAAFHDGYNSGNTGFYDSGGLGGVIGSGGGLAPTNWGATVRAEYLLVGDRTPEFNPFSEYDQFTAMKAKQDIVVVGGGADYSESGDNKVIFHTVDAQYDGAGGLGAYIAYEGAYRNFGTDKGIPKGSYYDNGVLLQASYMVNEHLEPFARYDYLHLDGKATPGIFKDALDEITVGANWYFHGQNAKFTVDATWLPNGCPIDLTNLGILQNDGRNEFLLRAQFQLAL